MTQYQPYKRYFDDFRVGDIIEHWPRKTITESDNSLFCSLTMNHHPLHSDSEYAAGQQHRRIVVAGTYVFSLVVGMSVPDISGASIANLSYENIIHHAPVFLGDTISARTEIVNVRRSKSKPDRGVVTVETEAFNQHGEKVLSLRRNILIPVRPSLE